MMGQEEKASTLGIPFGVGLLVRMPSEIGPKIRNPGATTLICYSRGFLALMMHLGALKLLDIGM